MYGSGNSGPRREVWRPGDRVKLVGMRETVTGKVAHPRGQEMMAHQTGFVWVSWDDGFESWCDPNHLDVDTL